MRHKGGLVEIMMNFIKGLKAKDPKNVRFIWLDNAGENLGLRGEGIETNLEFSSPETPEQNGQVERSFATLFGRVRAIFNCSGELWDKLWVECASTANKLSNIMYRKDGLSPYQRFYGKEAKLSNNLKIFGVIGIKKSKLYGLPEKLANKRNYCLFLGYPEDHPADTYRVLDLKNMIVMLSQNVRWLSKTYGEFFNTNSEKIKENTDLESSDEEEIRFENCPEISTEQVVPKVKEIPTFTMVTRSKAVSDAPHDDLMDSDLSSGDASLLINDEIKSKPISFYDAYNDSNMGRRYSWHQAIKKELSNMEK
jgi:hypothetical protein